MQPFQSYEILHQVSKWLFFLSEFSILGLTKWINCLGLCKKSAGGLSSCGLTASLNHEKEQSTIKNFQTKRFHRFGPLLIAIDKPLSRKY